MEDDHKKFTVDEYSFSGKLIKTLGTTLTKLRLVPFYSPIVIHKLITTEPVICEHYTT